MCFSQKASFGAAVVMVGIGVIAMGKARTGTQRVIACMPLLYAAQQCTEGFVWMSLLQPQYAHFKRQAMYAFLVFAEMVWPVYMPLISWLAEGRTRRRPLLGSFVIIGALMAVQLTYGLVAWPADVRLQDDHLLYDLSYPPANTLWYGFVYFAATMAAPLLSRHRLFKLLGVALLVSYIFSRVFYNHYIISIWCYFAAFISLIAVAMIYQLNKEAAGERELARAY